MRIRRRGSDEECSLLQGGDCRALLDAGLGLSWACAWNSGEDLPRQRLVEALAGNHYP